MAFNLFIFGCVVFVAVCGLSLVVASGGYSICDVQASHCGGFSCCRAWAWGCMGSEVVAHGPGCPKACGIFLEEGLNPCPLHWKVTNFTGPPGKFRLGKL